MTRPSDDVLLKWATAMYEVGSAHESGTTLKADGRRAILGLRELLDDETATRLLQGAVLWLDGLMPDDEEES